jgi:hypothetical protein
MKIPLSLGIVFLFIGMTSRTLSGTQGRGENKGIQDRFVGAWRLAMRSTKALTPSATTSRAHSCAPSSAKTCRAHSSYPATS